MTDTPPPYPWLPQAACLTWLSIDPDSTSKVAQVELARQAAAAWVEDQRPDLRGGTAEAPVYLETPNPRIVQAGILVTARIYTRQSSPAGLVSFDQFATTVLKSDPDVRALLGRARPKVG